MALHHPAQRPCSRQVASSGLICISCSSQHWTAQARQAVQKHTVASSFLAKCAANDRHLPPFEQSRNQASSSHIEAGDIHHACVIHRLWINLGPMDESPAASLKLQLGPLGVQRLKTWQPCVQWFWVYYMSVSEKAWLEAEVEGLEVKFIEAHHLHPNTVAALLACGTPIQFIKDIFSLKVLHAYGGIFADLDVIWLGVPFPLSNTGYMFGLEPHPRESGAFMGNRVERLTLSILAAPKDSAPIHSMYQKLFTHWKNFALNVFSGKNQPLHIGTGWHKLWMWNTNAVTLIVKKCPTLIAAIQKPVVLRPLPKALNAEGLTHMIKGLVDNEVLHRPNNMSQPYPCPSLATVAKYSVVIDTWERQWAPDVQEFILEWAQSHRTVPFAAYHTIGYAEFQLKLQAEILQWLPEIQASHPMGHAYALVGHALQLLEHSWSPTVFMQINRVWPDRNNTPTTHELWARVLLLHALGMNAGHCSNARDLLKSHLYTSRLETASCAAIKALLQMFIQLSQLE